VDVASGYTVGKNGLTRINDKRKQLNEYSLSYELTRAAAHSRPKKRSLSNKLTQKIQLVAPEIYKSRGSTLTDQIVLLKTNGHKGSPQ